MKQSFEVIYTSNAEELIKQLFPELIERQSYRFKFVPSGDQWFLPVYEFEGYAKDFDLQNKDDVSVNANFVVLKDTFVDYTDYRFYAKLLRFLWRFTWLHRLVDIVSKWHNPANKHFHRTAQPSVLSE
jgi:hypothetical protein